MNLQEAIGGTIRKIRHEQGLTLREASSRNHIAYGYWSEVETGKKGASNHILEHMANALDLTTIELVEEIYNYLKENN